MFIAAMVVNARRRRREIAAQLAALGFSHNLKPDAVAKAEAFNRTGRMLLLKTGPRGVVSYASGIVEGQEVWLVEHQYTTGSGKSRQVHKHIVAATPCPRAWPDLSVTPENLFDKIAGLMGRKDLSLESEAFNKRWKILAENEDFALLVLSPSVQDWAMRLPKSHQVHIGSGALCVVVSRFIRPAEYGPFCRLPLELAALLPQELAEWLLKE